MKFVSIDDVKVEEMSLDALKAFLVENAFFKFMDSGRQGTQHGAEDAIDNFAAWIGKRGPFGRKFRTCSLGEYHALRKNAQAALINGLIKNGSAGIKEAVDQIYLMTLDALIEENK